MLTRLQIPTLAIPGNHEYRSYPRWPRSSGLEVVGLNWEQSESLLRKAGMWGFSPICRRDLDALSNTDAAGVPALADYLMRVSPATDYCCSVGGLHLVFASSGADILAKWRGVERARWGLLLRGLRTARYHPDSEGFSDAQLTNLIWILACLSNALVAGQTPITPPATAIDRAFNQLYNYDFAGAHATLDAEQRIHPEDPLIYAVGSAAYLFSSGFSSASTRLRGASRRASRI